MLFLDLLDSVDNNNDDDETGAKDNTCYGADNGNGSNARDGDDGGDRNDGAGGGSV